MSLTCHILILWETLWILQQFTLDDPWSTVTIINWISVCHEDQNCQKLNMYKKVWVLFPLFKQNKSIAVAIFSSFKALTVCNELEIQNAETHSDKINNIFAKISVPKSLWRMRVQVSCEPVISIVSVLPQNYMLDIISYPFLSRLYRFSSCVFNMASPIAFRLGVKNAGRLANFLSLTPKVCLQHAVVSNFQFCSVFLW